MSKNDLAWKKAKFSGEQNDTQMRESTIDICFEKLQGSVLAISSQRDMNRFWYSDPKYPAGLQRWYQVDAAQPTPNILSSGIYSIPPTLL